uniref:Uncharacterized protein n=1 Tax=Anguilla anguilla TaxID=7936 RepID=A0A0E9TUQ3_ANGAN
MPRSMVDTLTTRRSVTDLAVPVEPQPATMHFVFGPMGYP